MAQADSLTVATIQEFLVRLSEQFTEPTTIYLIGGSALYLLGNERTTGDIDYVGHDLPKPGDVLQLAIRRIAGEMSLEVEGVPLYEFMPLPEGADQRHRLIKQFGNLSVYLFDPYSIALSKIDRGFESDLEDVLFLIRQGFITLEQLEEVTRAASPRAKEFSMNSMAMRDHLATVRQMLGALS